MAMIKNIDELEFIIFCIENVALQLKISACDVYAMFIEKNIISYLIENFDVLHTLSKEYIVDDIMTLMKDGDIE